MEKASVQFSHSVVSKSLQSHGLQHSKPPCSSPTPGVYPNSCPLSWWCHPTISSSVIPFSRLLSFQASRVFSNEEDLCIRWSKYWSFSFSISPLNEYSGLIPFPFQQALGHLLLHYPFPCLGIRYFLVFGPLCAR